MPSLLDLSEYNWENYRFPKGSDKELHYNALLKHLDWPSLTVHASSLHNGEACRMEDIVGQDWTHVLRMLTFVGGDRWVAKFRLPTAFNGDQLIYDATANEIQMREATVLRLLAQRTSVPVPRLIDSGTSDARFGGVPYMITECLPGSVVVETDFRDAASPAQRANFLHRLAEIQAQIYNLTFPKIGTLITKGDGTIDIGPIPDLGGPFDTASGYLRAWAEKKEWPSSEAVFRQRCGDYDSDPVWDSVTQFRPKLLQLADRICHESRNHGPFPLLHPQFGSPSIVIDSSYDILGIIDWEGSIVGPWERAEFPWAVIDVIPPRIDVPEKFNTDGSPKDESTKRILEEQAMYVESVRQAEVKHNFPSTLSDILADVRFRDLAAGLSIWEGGKPGTYSRLLDAFEESE